MCAHAEALHSADMDSSTCNLFSWNPYKSAIPFVGYFDISVIVRALATNGKGKISSHVTTGEGVSELRLPGQAGEDSAVGLIVNLLRDSFFGITSTRHWFSIVARAPRGTNESESAEAESVVYWNLDSQLEQPVAYQSGDELKAFLTDVVKNQSGHIFVISE